MEIKTVAEAQSAVDAAARVKAALSAQITSAEDPAELPGLRRQFEDAENAVTVARVGLCDARILEAETAGKEARARVDEVTAAALKKRSEEAACRELMMRIQGEVNGLLMQITFSRLAAEGHSKDIQEARSEREALMKSLTAGATR